MIDEGIEYTPAMIAFHKAMGEALLVTMKKADRLQKERDDLLMALKGMLVVYNAYSEEYGDIRFGTMAHVARARELIAKMEAG